MKKLFCFLVVSIVFLSISSIVSASPFIVCDPYPANAKPDGFIYTLDSGQEVTVVYKEEVRNAVNVAVILDVGALPEGAHVINVKPYNIWGSLAPVPFSFTKALPTALKNTRLSK